MRWLLGRSAYVDNGAEGNFGQHAPHDDEKLLFQPAAVTEVLIVFVLVIRVIPLRGRLRRTLSIAAAALAVAGATGCSPSTSGAPEPTTQTPTSSSDKSQLDNPKNVEAITDACTLLTRPQLKQLGAAATGEKETTMYGEAKCTWTNDNFSATVSLNATTGFGVADIKEQGRAQGTLTEVKGYPAMPSAPKAACAGWKWRSTKDNRSPSTTR